VLVVPADPSGDDVGLIVGIVLGCVGLALMLAVLAAFIIVNRRKRCALAAGLWGTVPRRCMWGVLSCILRLKTLKP
jgi:hypothetical protein